MPLKTESTESDLEHGAAGGGRLKDLFRRVAARAAGAVGSASAFLVASAVIIAWAVTGPLFHFSDTWQLVINTGTTIVTFLMVFLIQNTQNRDARAIHLKLNELIRANRGARNQLIDLEELPDEALDHLHQQFQHLCAKGLPGGSDVVAVIQREVQERGLEGRRAARQPAPTGARPTGPPPVPPQ